MSKLMHILLHVDFTAFKPERALYLAKRSIGSIYTGSPHDFQPLMVLDFFPRLLTSTTVA